jgi:hypothetical protein
MIIAMNFSLTIAIIIFTWSVSGHKFNFFNFQISNLKS